MNNLETTFINQSYLIDFPNDKFILKLQVNSEKFTSLLKAYSIEIWAIVTAYNPQSVKTENDLNIKQQQHLKNDIKNPFFHGENLATDAWEAEPTFFIHNISKEKAIALGNKYQQLAIIYGAQNSSAQLIWCSSE